MVARSKLLVIAGIRSARWLQGGAGALVDPGDVDGNNIAFRDITSGNNGAPCLVDYELVTGRGSWTS
ncbi:MAG TPA: hypothetical protein VGC06_27100 [Actinomycetes bacterium]